MDGGIQLGRLNHKMTTIIYEHDSCDGIGVWGGGRPKWLVTISLHYDLLIVYDTYLTLVWVFAMGAPPVQWRAQGSWMFTQWRSSSNS
jgi:hypothetical protein